MVLSEALCLSGAGGPSRLGMKKPASFKYFKTSPDVIRLAVMLYIRNPFSSRNLEDLLHENGIDESHETVRYWWNRIGRVFASEIRRNACSNYVHRRNGSGIVCSAQ